MHFMSSVKLRDREYTQITPKTSRLCLILRVQLTTKIHTTICSVRY